MPRTIDPSTLKITDMRFADIDGAPKRCTLIKVYTNQGLNRETVASDSDFDAFSQPSMRVFIKSANRVSSQGVTFQKSRSSRYSLTAAC